MTMSSAEALKRVVCMVQTLVRRVGSGTGGLVESACNHDFGHHVYKWCGDRDGDWESLNKEAEILSLVRHPNIVQYFGRCHHAERHPAKMGIILERLKMTAADLIFDPSCLK